MTTVGALQGLGDVLRVGHYFAEALPYQLVGLVGGSVPGGALPLQAGLGLLVLAGADRSTSAARVCRPWRSASWSSGSELIGFSTNSTLQPPILSSSMRTIWCT